MAPSAIPTMTIEGDQTRQTRILPVQSIEGSIDLASLNEQWAAYLAEKDNVEVSYILEAVAALRDSNIPVAFPTETVYGLGADATRSSVVQGIYSAKQRPSDNPLIVHFSSLDQIRRFMRPPEAYWDPHRDIFSLEGLIRLEKDDLIPEIYHALISRFWPGPLTIILPNPNPSLLAKEVTSTLSTFGARIPSSPLALLLIQISGRPLAAPSANASTKPSPTTAQHVYDDLNGRIDIILDGGPCGVGVESTVVDGLSDPPTILRPGGVGIEELRQCKGWENVIMGYKDKKLEDDEVARAPGMKYRHYAPRARVVLFESGKDVCGADIMQHLGGRGNPSLGVVRTRRWKKGLGLFLHNNQDTDTTRLRPLTNGHTNGDIPTLNGATPYNGVKRGFPLSSPFHFTSTSLCGQDDIEIYDVNLGPDLRSVARGLFFSLRALDEKDVDVIFVEGISDREGDLAAAIMNRLRKASEVEVKG